MLNALQVHITSIIKPQALINALNAAKISNYESMFPLDKKKREVKIGANFCLYWYRGLETVKFLIAYASCSSKGHMLPSLHVLPDCFIKAHI